MANSQDQSNSDSQESKKPISLNPNATPYVFKPPAKTSDKASTINVSAKPFIPKQKRNQLYEQEEDKHEIPPDALEEFEDDLFDQLEDEQTDWIKECQDCPCCQGWVYLCSGEACKFLSSCYCKVKLDIEQNGVCE